MTRTFLLLSALIGFAVLTPAYAQDSLAKEENSALKEWVAAENALIDPLSKLDKESFFILRNKHSIIRVIRVVERDIKNAVKSCGDKNPDMKNAMNDRFKQWQDAVVPILDTAQKQLNKDLDNQTIVDVKKAKEVLKLNDKAYEYGEKQVTKQPVTSKEACQGLIDSMDRTENTMIGLLQDTLLPESVIRSRADAVEEKAPAQPKKDFSKKAP